MTETRRLTDPETLKALAHPLRRQLYRLLSELGPATATHLIERVDAEPGQVSYHLRELAKRGFVEEAPELVRDRRERWWRALPGSIAWSTTDFADPAGPAVAQTAQQLLVEEQFERLRAYQAVAETWSREWRDAATVTNTPLRLTVEEMRALCAELNEVLARWAEVGRLDPKLRPDERTADGRDHVLVFYHAFPEKP